MLVLALLATVMTPVSDGDTAPRVVVHGRVTDVRGLPVADGEILAYPIDLPRCSLRGFLPFVEPLARVPGAASFEIEVEAPCELVFRSEASLTVLTALIRSVEDAALDQEIVVTRTTPVSLGFVFPSLAGSVVDEEGAPFRDVRVRLVTPPSFDERFLRPDRTRQRWLTVPDAVTGDLDMFWQSKGARDGDFRLPALGIPGATIAVEVDGEILGSISSPIAPTEGLRIVLRRERIRGHVRAADGTPASGASVRFGNKVVSTEADGRFEVSPGPLVRRGTSLVVGMAGHEAIEMPDFGDRLREGRITGDLDLQLIASGPEARAREAEAAEAAARNATGELVPAGDPLDRVASLVRGRVVTRAGEPIEGVMLQFETAGMGEGATRVGPFRSATTDEDGRFEVRDLARCGTRVSLLGDWGFGVMPWESRRLVLDRHDEVTLVMSRSVQVSFERRRADLDADRIAFVDDEGRRLSVQVELPRAAWESLIGPKGPFETVRLLDNQSYVAHVPGEVKHVVVLAGTRELARVPVRHDAASTARGSVLVTW